MTDTAYRVIGQRVPKVDGIERATGSALYGTDLRLPGMLHGKVLRSPHAHARIVRIDTRKAEALPGVLAVVTRDDFPELEPGTTAPLGEIPIDLVSLTWLLMAREKALFVGHPVAAVAATDLHVAEAALALIDVEYEVLQPVTTIEQALVPDAPLLHERLMTAGVEPPPTAPSNVSRRTVLERGDVAAGLAAADVVIERRYRADAAHQGYLEPVAAVAQAEPDGRVTVWTSTQGTFTVEWQLSVLLKMPMSRLRVVPLEVGGAFGGKIYAHVEPLCVRLAQKAGRPVRIVLTREEVLRATGPGAAAIADVRAGATRDGTLTALEVRMWMEAGAFPGSPVANALLVGGAPYKVANLRLEGFDVVANKPRVEPYRGPGGPQANFAVEQAIDELAQRLGLDPLDLRRRNGVVAGDPLPTGRSLPAVGLAQVLDAVARHPCWTDPLPPGRHPRGRGLAIGFWHGQSFTSSCQVAVTGDGTLSVTIGAVDITGIRTALAQVAAEEFGLSVEQVAIQTGDTETSGYSDVAAGSRTARTMAAAVGGACREALARLKERAAARLECAAEDVEYVEQRFQVKGIPDRAIGLAQLARLTMVEAGGPVITEGVTQRMPAAPTFAAHVADVEVDPATGKVSVLRYTAFQDVGRAINPTQVEGQMQGGAVQGIGWALTEGEDFDERGWMRNASLLDYRMPTALDVPPIDCVIVEVPAPDVPYGLRGVGEVPIVPPAAAVANAVARAIGQRAAHMPMTPERVLRALRGDAFGQV